MRIGNTARPFQAKKAGQQIDAETGNSMFPLPRYNNINALLLKN